LAGKSVYEVEGDTMTSGQFPDLLRGDRAKQKIATVMGEYKRGTLRSGSGKKVRNRKQAIAIALSEAYRKATKK
jgi:hypothetical protein